MRTKQQGADLSSAISGTMETPMCAPTIARRLERWPLSKTMRGVQAGAVAGGDRSFAEAVSIAEKKKRIEAQIGETKRRPKSELVLFGERGEEAFRKQRERFEIVAANGQRRNGEVDGARAEAVEQDGSDLLGDGELDLGKFAGERSEKRRKEIGATVGMTPMVSGPPMDCWRSTTPPFAGALHAFEGKSPFAKESLAQIGELKRIYGMTLHASDGLKLKEKAA